MGRNLIYAALFAELAYAFRLFARAIIYRFIMKDELPDEDVTV